MKLKASPHARKIVVEMESGESDLPPISVPEVALKKILVPVDFSDLSRKALHYAVSFAKQFGAEISLLHVLEIIPTPEAVVAESIYLSARLREQADRELSDLRRELSDVEIKSSTQTGVPFREIVRVAEETNVDLIILGTQGRTGLSHLFIGSTAERVVRHAPCPVMVVREREHDFLKEENRAARKEEGTSGKPRSQRRWKK